MKRSPAIRGLRCQPTPEDELESSCVNCACLSWPTPSAYAAHVRCRFVVIEGEHAAMVRSRHRREG
jgi:hypothetical protein